MGPPGFLTQIKSQLEEVSWTRACAGAKNPILLYIIVQLYMHVIHDNIHQRVYCCA